MHSSTLVMALLTAQVAVATDAQTAAPADSILRNGRILAFSGPERNERADDRSSRGDRHPRWPYRLHRHEAQAEKSPVQRLR